MNRIFCTGDKHGEIDMFRSLSTKAFKPGRELDKQDYLIIAGDFGVLWKSEPDATERYLIKWLTDKKWTTLFIDGNHENFVRLAALPEVDMFGGKVGKLNDSIYHLKRGYVYNICGNKIFCFGGAMSHDKWHRKLGISLWEEEIPNYQEVDFALRNLEKVNFEVDYMICHNAPRTVVASMGFVSFGSNEDPTCKYLEHMVSVAKFRKFYFGHHHDNKCVGRYHCLYDRVVNLGE